MSPSDRRKSRRRQLQASHQKSWLIGRYAVTEALRAAKWPFEELYVADTLPAAGTIEVKRLADQAGIRINQVSAERLTELCSAAHHQGFAARMGPYPYESLAQLLERLRGVSLPDSQTVPIIVVCDRIQDTFNFGAILRSCDATSVTAIVIGTAQQAGVTPQVARSSAGAVHHMPVVMADSLVDVAMQLQSIGFQIVAASEKAETSLWAGDLSGPIALVIGSEAHGISSDLRDVCDLQVSIPMQGKLTSLNAAVAAGILLYEIRRQHSVHGP